MPYRIDVENAADALDRVIELGALDAEIAPSGTLAALMPDSVAPQTVAHILGIRTERISISPAIGRDADSVWILSPRVVQIGRLRIVPAHSDVASNCVRLIDAPAFGTGLHSTTALCLEVLEQLVEGEAPDSMLDVGTGSGVLALSALMLGVPHVLAIDVDPDALRTVAENARLNGLAERLKIAQGGPESVAGTWPLVFANILAAPLIEMAPLLIRRVGHRGSLVLSGIPQSVEPDVTEAYTRLGMHRLSTQKRAGWVALVLKAGW